MRWFSVGDPSSVAPDSAEASAKKIVAHWIPMHMSTASPHPLFERIRGELRLHAHPISPVIEWFIGESVFAELDQLRTDTCI
eukprot:4036462-Pyramimonas_sp.AAC.1